MQNVFDAAIKQQLELLQELPPELAQQYRELLQDAEQFAAALKRAKQSGDVAALHSLQAQAAMFERKLAALGEAFAAAQRTAQATKH